MESFTSRVWKKKKEKQTHCFASFLLFDLIYFIQRIGFVEQEVRSRRRSWIKDKINRQRNGLTC